MYTITQGCMVVSVAPIIVSAIGYIGQKYWYQLSAILQNVYW